MKPVKNVETQKTNLRLTSKNDTFLEAFPPIPFEATQANSPESSAVAFKTVNSTTPTFSLAVKTLFTLLEAVTEVKEDGTDCKFSPEKRDKIQI